MCEWVTLVGEVIKVELEGVVVTSLGGGDKGAVEGLDLGVGAELLHLADAGPRDGHGHEVPLGGIGGNVVLHTIEVGQRDVNGLPLVAAFPSVRKRNQRIKIMNRSSHILGKQKRSTPRAMGSTVNDRAGWHWVARRLRKRK